MPGARVRLYLTGGATAVLEGWRDSTVDIDLRLEPETDELLRELPRLKETLGINIELASPLDFIPELPGWRERSPLVFREGNVDVHHFAPAGRRDGPDIRFVEACIAIPLNILAIAISYLDQAATVPRWRDRWIRHSAPPCSS